MTLNQLIKFYGFNTKEQLFNEMENCLEERGIHEGNYDVYVKQFEKNYLTWLKANGEE